MKQLETTRQVKMPPCWSDGGKNRRFRLRFVSFEEPAVLKLGGGFKHFLFMFTSIWGNDPI